MRELLIAGITLVIIWLVAVLILLLLGRRTLARELLTLLPNLARLFRGLIGDPRVPGSSKALLLLAGIWLASPIDLIPEFLPGIGGIDDAVVAALVLRHLVRRAGADVVREHWHGDPHTIGLVLRSARAA
jgi:uncharacterized membrane protein YkvA (DUF1232 family)